MRARLRPTHFFVVVCVFFVFVLPFSFCVFSFSLSLSLSFSGIPSSSRRKQTTPKPPNPNELFEGGQLNGASDDALSRAQTNERRIMMMPTRARANVCCLLVCWGGGQMTTTRSMGRSAGFRMSSRKRLCASEHFDIAILYIA